MSTRAVVHIRKSQYYNDGNPNNGTKYLQYYHHWDGYTSGLGIKLMKLSLKYIDERSPRVTKFMSDVKYWLEDNLNQSYQRETYGKDLHGDIEYAYLLDFDCGVTLTRFKRTDWKNEKHDNWQEWGDKVVLFRATDEEMGEISYYDIDKIYYSKEIN